MIFLAATLALQSLSAADFYPLIPGAVYRYEDSSMKQLMTLTVGEPKKVGKYQVTPVSSKVGAGHADTLLYHVNAEGVYIVALDPNSSREKVLGEPQPLFLWANGNGPWDFTGETVVATDPQQIKIKGETKLMGERTVFGKKVPTLRVTVDVSIGVGYLTAKQEVWYGKGIGLLESKETSIFLGKVYKRTTKLADVRLPQGT